MDDGLEVELGEEGWFGLDDGLDYLVEVAQDTSLADVCLEQLFYRQF